MSYDENNKSLGNQTGFMQKRRPRHIPGNLPAHQPEPAARLECLRLVSGRFDAVTDLFRMIPVLRRLHIPGLRHRMNCGRALTPTQFYRYMNRC